MKQSNTKKTFFIILITDVFLIGANLYFFSFLNLNQPIIINNPPIKISALKTSDALPEETPYYLEDLTKIKENLLLNEVSFLEIHLSDMKIRIYKMGILEKEAPILAKGDEQEWGGTPAGLYKLMDKNRLAFSSISKVYMPYSLHFYGTYYIHGEPYYPGGEPLISDISGGCIRLSNRNAKIIYEGTEKGMPVLVIDKENDDYKYQTTRPAQKEPEVSAKNYLAADLDSGFVFMEKNPQAEVPIASLTKLMTAIVVSESINRRRSILVKSWMLEAYGSTQGLEAGEWFRFVELLYPLLIESSNDAAEVLTYFLGREKTIRLMNEKTKAILMEKTSFIDPSGLGAENVSTAQDLFYLARYVLNTRFPFLKISKGEKVVSFGEVRFDVQNLKNKNIFAENPDFIGGKTGFITASKYVGLFIFEIEERKIAIILLGSPTLNDLEKDAQNILNWLKPASLAG